MSHAAGKGSDSLNCTFDKLLNRQSPKEMAGVGYLFRGDDDELMVGTWGVEIWNWSESIEWISSVETRGA